MDRGAWWASVQGVTKSWTRMTAFTLRGYYLRTGFLERKYIYHEKSRSTHFHVLLKVDEHSHHGLSPASFARP